jgi:hypothetical protein
LGLVALEDLEGARSCDQPTQRKTGGHIVSLFRVVGLFT